MTPVRPRLAATAAILVLCACAAGPTDDPRRSDPPTGPGALRRPPPTEHRLDDAAEGENKARRKEWMRERHRAAPDVDTGEIERRNGDAQRVKRNRLAAMSAATVDRWTERGSRNQAGRMHMATRSSDGTMLYAGSSKGGVWRATPDGQGWTPLGDNIHGGAHWLVVVSGVGPGDPDVMLRATDDGQVHRSTDDGATWTVPANIPADMANVRRLLVTSDGTETILILVRYWLGGQLRNNVLYSTDKGATFHFSNGLSTWEGDVWAPRNGAGPLFTLKLDKVQRSDDNGLTWFDVGTLPVTSNGGELTGSEAGAPRLWAVLDRNSGRELWRSDDAGATWTYKAAVGDYWGTLQASIVDPDLFAYGGVEVWRTTDGGDTFARVNGWAEYYSNPAGKLHADIPGMDVVPAPGGETWYVSTDGGLFRSTDGLASVQNLSLDGLRVSQYYSTHTSVANPLHVAAGSQDQGFQWADQPPAGGDTLLEFEQVISGDYGHLSSSDGSHDYLYMTYPGFVMVHRGENAPNLHFVDFPANEHAWLPSVVADPWSKVRFFFCGDVLYRFEKNVGSFTWSGTPWSAHDFGPAPGEYMTEMVFSPANTVRAYAVSNLGKLWTSTNHGVDWVASADVGPGAQYFYGTALLASAHDEDRVWVGGSGYSNPPVLRSTDGGQTWQDWGQGLPPTLVYALAESPDGSAIYCGTETAAYERKIGTGSWVDITDDDAPITTYWSAEAVAAENVIRFGTYGRGIWDYQLQADCAYAAYGVGLGGANSVTLDTASFTFKGTTHVLEVTGGPASTGGLLMYSANPASLPIYGGTLLIDVATWLFWPIVVGPDGAATIPLSIPANPLAVGLPLNFQVALQDGPAFDDWAFSNGLQGVICE